MSMRKILLVVAILLFGFLIIHGRFRNHGQNPVAMQLSEDLVGEGMTTTEVANLLGAAEEVINEPENGLEAWTYYEPDANLESGLQLGGLTVVFKDGVVHKVLPIFVNSRVIGGSVK